jgi:hypothetical protein
MTWPKDNWFKQEEEEYQKNQARYSADIARNHRAYEEQVMNELYEAAQRVTIPARKLVMDYKLVLSHDFSGDIDIAEQQQIYNLKMATLEDLKSHEIVESLRAEVQPVDWDNIFVCWVNFYPEKLIKFVTEERLKVVPITFDEESGEFRVEAKTIILKRGYMEYEFVKFLYNHPNKNHSYEAIGKAIGLSDKEYDSVEYSNAMRRAGYDRRVDPQLARLKNSINNKVDEIRGKLGMKGKEDIFICNNGYMLKR